MTWTWTATFTAALAILRWLIFGWRQRREDRSQGAREAVADGEREALKRAIEAKKTDDKVRDLADDAAFDRLRRSSRRRPE